MDESFFQPYSHQWTRKMESWGNPGQPLISATVSVPDQIEGLWFRGKLMEECLRSVCTRQSNRIPQTQP